MNEEERAGVRRKISQSVSSVGYRSLGRNIPRSGLQKKEDIRPPGDFPNPERERRRKKEKGDGISQAPNFASVETEEMKKREMLSKMEFGY